MFTLPSSLIPDAPKRSSRYVVETAMDEPEEVDDAEVVSTPQTPEDKVTPEKPEEANKPEPNLSDGDAEVAADPNAPVAPIEAKTATETKEVGLADPKEMERTMTLRQLRDLCTQQNLPSNGKKSELVARLHQHALS